LALSVSWVNGFSKKSILEFKTILDPQLERLKPDSGQIEQVIPPKVDVLSDQPADHQWSDFFDHRVQIQNPELKHLLATVC
jgi:hypothetical protein